MLTKPGQFAIRPSIRSNTKFKRDDVIKTVAAAVGHDHSVDLKNYDLLILVDVIQVSCSHPAPTCQSARLTGHHSFPQNIIGMAVVGSDYDRLKRFNLSELYAPTSKAPREAEDPAPET